MLWSVSFWSACLYEKLERDNMRGEREQRTLRHNYQHHPCSVLCCHSCNAPRTPSSLFGKLSSDNSGKVDRALVHCGQVINHRIAGLLSWQLVDHEQFPRRVFSDHIAFCLTHGMLLDMNTIALPAQPAARWRVSDESVLGIVVISLQMA